MREISQETNNLSYQIIGAAMEVHRSLGPRLLESIYEDALCIELEERNIPYERQKIVDVQYKGCRLGDMRLDILVADSVILELKSVEKLLGINQAQLMTYLKITQKRLGLLINFNIPVLKNGIKRVIL